MVAIRTLPYLVALAGCVCAPACSSPPDAFPGCGETFLSATFELPDGTTREFCIPGAVMQANFDAPSGCRLIGSSIGLQDTHADLSIFTGDDWFGSSGSHSPVGFVLQSPEIGCDIPERGCTFGNYTQCEFNVVHPALADGQIVTARLANSCPLNTGAGAGTTNFPTLVAANFRARLTSVMNEEGGFQCFYPYDSGIGPP